jgi:hypothetical protein
MEMVGGEVFWDLGLQKLEHNSYSKTIKCKINFTFCKTFLSLQKNYDMNNYFLIPRFWKWIGLILYISTVIYANKTDITDFDNIYDIRGLLIQISILISLLLMILSKVKIEDEWSQAKRLSSFQISLIIFILLRLGLKITAFMLKDPIFLPKMQINFYLLLYLIVFYFQLYIKPYFIEYFNKDDK